MTYDVKVINNGGSLSESDLVLLSGTDVIMNMMRNRRLVMIEQRKKCNWFLLTDNMKGLYYIRSVDDKTNIWQLWFELPDDLDAFEKNLAMAKLSDTIYVE
tara:strand:- start:445 stop:747 length:303 start_codon:yes stop_codon:yes gene_type:complete